MDASRHDRGNGVKARTANEVRAHNRRVLREARKRRRRIVFGFLAAPLMMLMFFGAAIATTG